LHDEANGFTNDEDPREKSYIYGDGMHTSDVGQKAIADWLRDMGHEPISP
jgi:hypothetical protein